MRSQTRSVSLVVILLVAIGVWPMLSALGQPGDVIPGLHLGDNVAALWNTWWFTHAVEQGEAIYRTDMLFAPAGTQLSLHTHSTTHSVLAWPLAAVAPIVTAHNLALTTGLILNGLCAWLLAFRLTGAVLPSLAAGVIFGLSAFVQIHALGHVNLLHAWVLPLFALAVIRLPAAGFRGALACGVAAALVVYTDYYYAVYAGIFGMLWLVFGWCAASVRTLPARAPRLRTVLVALLAVFALVIVTVAVTGGTAIDLGFTRVSIRGLRNPLTAFWILLAAWLIARYPLSISVRRRPDGGVPWRTPAIAAATMVALTSPLLVALAGVVAAGDYSTQEVLWRSSPPGADVATVLLGHPRHALWGVASQAAYGSLGIDVMEQSLYVGIIPLLLIVSRTRTWVRSAGARFWLLVGVVFMVLALGPFLRVAGIDTALPLPQALLRYAPVLSNARIPGRAVVMVQLAVAMLSACALAGLPRTRAFATLVTVAIAIELWPATLPVQRVPGPDAVDRYLARQTGNGAVVELPLGLRDGFGETGHLDHRALAHQLWHGRPIAGGFVARLPDSVRAAQLGSPPLAALLEASTPDAPPVSIPADLGEALASTGIHFVVVNRDTSVSARLPRATLEAVGLVLVAVDGSRELYRTGGR